MITRLPASFEPGHAYPPAQVDITIVCMTYAQQDYIADALNGFLAQKFSGSFEVVVHDDVSPDGTLGILKDFEARYPDCIHVIEEEENQYSHHAPLYMYERLIPFIRGRYVAWCEGDDYWIDARKLQKQFDFLEAHADYAACLHNALIIEYRRDYLALTEARQEDCDKDAAQLIEEGGGYINPTASFMYRREALWHYQDAPVDDHFAFMTVADRGKVRWMHEPMSVYRAYAAGSWTGEHHLQDALDKRIAFYDDYIRALDEMDELTKHRYRAAFDMQRKLRRTNRAKELMIADYLQGRIGLREALRRSPSKTASARLFLQKHCKPARYEKIQRDSHVRTARNAGTLLAEKALPLPQWAQPLRAEETGQ